MSEQKHNLVVMPKAKGKNYAQKRSFSRKANQPQPQPQPGASNENLPRPIVVIHNAELDTERTFSPVTDTIQGPDVGFNRPSDVGFDVASDSSTKQGAQVVEFIPGAEIPVPDTESPPATSGASNDYDQFVEVLEPKEKPESTDDDAPSRSSRVKTSVAKKRTTSVTPSHVSAATLKSLSKSPPHRNVFDDILKDITRPKRQDRLSARSEQEINQSEQNKPGPSSGKRANGVKATSGKRSSKQSNGKNAAAQNVVASTSYLRPTTPPKVTSTKRLSTFKKSNGRYKLRCPRSESEDVYISDWCIQSLRRKNFSSKVKVKPMRLSAVTLQTVRLW